MTPMYIILLLIASLSVTCEEEGGGYIPALVWTSREFQSRTNIDYLLLRKVKPDLFEAYFMELLSIKTPLIVVFLEQDLSTDDFEWKDEKGDNSFPFLGNLTIKSRVDYFRSVAFPYETLAGLQQKGFSSKLLNSSIEFDYDEGDILLVEFDKIKTRRPETMKSHDEQIQEIHQRLIDSGRSWVAVYTGRHPRIEGFSELKQMSPWHVDRRPQEKSKRALSLYRDGFTGFTLVTKGSLQLLLPSPQNLAVENLENYLLASAKPQNDKMDFVVWFNNYTLHFHLIQSNAKWVIKGVKLWNGNGDCLLLTQREEKLRSEEKCYVQSTEFQNEGKPTVKLIVSKYKFLTVPTGEEPCEKPYGFHVTFCVILGSILAVVVCWIKLLEIWDFSTK